MHFLRPGRVSCTSGRMSLLLLAALWPACLSGGGGRVVPDAAPTDASSATGGALGTGGVGGATGGAYGSGGAAGAGTGGAAGAPVVVPDAAGPDVALASDGGGAQGKSCAGNAVSLSANGTGTASDAAQARVLMTLTGDLPLGNAARTVEFWAYIKPTDWVGERNAIYIYGPQTAPASTFGLDFGSFAVMGMAGNHATLNPVTNGGFNDDSHNYLGITSTAPQWVHIAMTWDGTAVKTYVNGMLRITSPGSNGITMLATLDSPLSVGCNPHNMACFSGLFDEFRLWKVARSEAEISGSYQKALSGSEPNLVGYWKFDEAPGATMAADSVTTPGHVAHPGMLMAASPAQLPKFVTPDPPAPVVCP
jgi:hypothetical protein